MVILDEPFVSEEVKVFLEQSQVPVLDNAFAARAGEATVSTGWTRRLFRHGWRRPERHCGC